MNDETNISLTWGRRENRQEPDPDLEFGVLDGVSGVRTTYGAALEVCGLPRCPCWAVCVSCDRLLGDGTLELTDSTPSFWLDVRERTVMMSDELKADSGLARLAEIIRARLSEAAWNDLYRWFRAAKLEAIQTAEIAEIDLTDLPNADGARMVGFVNVFPQGLALDFPFDNGRWAADEQYCVRLACTCKETVLSFLQYQDPTSREFIRLPKIPALRYNYRSGTGHEVMPGSAETPPPTRLLAALQTAHPNLNLQLELRHLVMQTLYGRDDVARSKAALARLGNTLGAASRMIGRNDRCPCGSGKKYKKCCGV